MAFTDKRPSAFTGNMAVIKVGGVTVAKIQEITYSMKFNRILLGELGRVGKVEAALGSFDGSGTMKIILSDPNYLTAANNLDQIRLNQYNSMSSDFIDNEVLETSWIINDPNRVDIYIYQKASLDYDATTHKPLGGVDGNKFSINANNLDGIGKNAGLQLFAILPGVYFTSDDVVIPEGQVGTRNLSFVFLDPVKLPKNQPIQ